MSAQKIEIVKIVLDPRLQMRESMHFDAIDEYAEHLADLPPGKVVTDGSVYWLTGGWHRYHAHRKAGATEMLCEVTEGTFADAVLEAAGENHGHGIRRTPADKRRSVLAVLGTPEHADKSDRLIAEVCKVSHSFVGNIRAETSTGRESSSKPRLGKDLKRRTPKPSKPKKDPEPANPRTAGLERLAKRGLLGAPALPQTSALHTKAQLVIDALSEIREVLQEAVAGSDGVLRAALEKQRKKLAEVILPEFDLILDRQAKPNGKFVKPTLEQVTFYCQSRGNKVNPAKWLAHYESNGWKVGKNPMKDWRAAVRTWEHSDFGANNGRISRVEVPADKYRNIGTTIRVGQAKNER